MGISFNFFDKAAAEDAEIAKRVEEENAALTEEERAAEQEQRKIEFEELLRQAEINIAAKQKQINKGKVKAFRELSKLAVRVAKDLELNVEIYDSENGLYGGIRFRAESIMIVEAVPEPVKKTFAAIIAAATETLIYTKQEYIELSMTYNFY
jgi:hypothetical protein